MKKCISIFLIALIISFTANAQVTYRYDVNGDGEENVSDVNLLINHLLGKLNPGEHEYVDLGLLSGTLWATCNVGAENPEEYGDYFACGEVVGYNGGKTTFSWSNYKYCNGGYNALNKYCTVSGFGSVDNKTELDVDDDAAYVYWGSDWRMPIVNQIDELRTSCTWIWITQNGVNGYKVTGTNGNSIFLPAAGYHASSFSYVGTCGYYWSRTISSGSPNWAYPLYFTSTKVSTVGDDRCIGLTVRPVRAVNADRIKISSITLDKTSLTITPSGNVTLSATVLPEDAFLKTCTWSSSNESAATVSSDGVVTGVAEGVSIITCKANDGSGVMATCSVTVTNLLPGKFSVSSTKKVQFTRSNLYWDGSAFKFEANQTDYPTSWDSCHVGHFFWTNLVDYQSSISSYMPYVKSYGYSSCSTSDKFWCGEDNPLTVEGTSGLFTLTGSGNGEWGYLVGSRPNATILRKYNVTVGDVSCCLIIAPDDFTGTLKSSYTLAEVDSLGLVCLPPTGYRWGLNFNLGNFSYYWSATPSSSYWSDSSYLFFSPGYVGAESDDETDRGYGYSVRLVRVAQ